MSRLTIPLALAQSGLNWLNNRRALRDNRQQIADYNAGLGSLPTSSLSLAELVNLGRGGGISALANELGGQPSLSRYGQSFFGAEGNRINAETADLRNTVLGNYDANTEYLSGLAKGDYNEFQRQSQFISDRYGSLLSDTLGEIGKVGDQASRNIDKSFGAQRGQIEAGLRQRGLAGTSILPSLLTGSRREQADAQGQLAESLANLRGGARERIGTAELGFRANNLANDANLRAGYTNILASRATGKSDIANQFEAGRYDRLAANRRNAFDYATGLEQQRLNANYNVNYQYPQANLNLLQAAGYGSGYTPPQPSFFDYFGPSAINLAGSLGSAGILAGALA